uniref:Macaca fascicularis brain cDNA clone: QflA-21680, similar to human ets variant gene 5 (ets-related molecule) (ETV5), mRNA, RefSeq: NM_004454.1 n=1 Tax=Macaca fascicularis TaxID=9541 RepID=I7GDA1_MACFA|nr:unnamed protein product [Macaca fascicularis]
MDLCCLSNMKIILCSLSYPSPAVTYVACAVTGHRTAASPLHSHRTHAPPGWFWVFSGVLWGWFVCFFSRVWKVYSAERL